AYGAKTSARVYHHAPGPRHAGGRAAGARWSPAGAAVGAGSGALPRRLVPPGRLPRARRDAGAVDPRPPRREGGRPRARAPRTARDAQRPRPQPAGVGLATAYLGLVP